MGKTAKDKELSEIGLALRRYRRGFIGVAVFSAFINLLMLTGPLYMLQVYDRVLISKSMSTLVVLSILMVCLYLVMGLLDMVRSRILVRIGNQLQADLNSRTFGIWMKQGAYGEMGTRNRPLDDLGTLKSFLSGPAPGAIFDVPWAPIFIAVIWYLHWTLGVMALIGSIIMFIIALINELSTKDTLNQSRGHTMQSRQIAETSHRQSDSITAMGMEKNILRRWNASNDEAGKLFTRGSDRAGSFSATTKAFRMALQSGVLGAGCGLAVIGIITPGGMIAASIIMGRALAPIQMALGQWKSVVAARAALDRLEIFFKAVPQETEALQLPEPTGQISVEHAFAAVPGGRTAVLRDINFALKPGQGLGVIGPSASGKSTLARILVGVWMPARGSVRIDGATYDQWNRDELGKHIGYLPQDVALLDGTIAENIARFNPEIDDQAVVQAAERASVHDMILQLPEGYKTQVGTGGVVLSGGQVQRVALARALYGDPALIVLDEPNANLDSEGDEALTKAILGSRERGNTVIVMTHRQSAIVAVDMLLALKGGQQVDFGPKAKVLETITGKPPGPRPVPNSPAPAQAGRAQSGAPLKLNAPNTPGQVSAPKNTVKPKSPRSITSGGPASSMGFSGVTGRSGRKPPAKKDS